MNQRSGSVGCAAAPSLASEIVGRIERGGPIPFDAFMELALYGERGGYYERGPLAIGPCGDFYTASDVSLAFGETLAEQIAECGRLLAECGRLHPGRGRLQDDEPFDLVELGAGKGTLASDILGRLLERHPKIYGRLTYWVVERSAGMRRAQEKILAPHLDSGKVRWAVGPEATRAGGIVGCVIANEFYDALPVRVVTRARGHLAGGDLMEMRVGLSGDPPRPCWVGVSADDPELLEYATTYGLAPTAGSTAEAGLAARRYARRVSRSIRKGFQIAIDYGERADRLYDPEIHPAGTLVAYHRHQLVQDPFTRIGEQDLTAHVNFSAIEDAGREADLNSLGFTTQDRFLIALGIADRVASLAASNDPADIRRRLAMMTLIHPEAMGRVFRVLVQAKGIPPVSLAGLKDPFAMSRASCAP